MERFVPGDPVIFRVAKVSQRPGPRAQIVYASPSGEDYTYTVDKYWVVQEVRNGNTLVLRTRRGKVRELPANSPDLRAPWFWERWFFSHRFPRLDELPPLPSESQNATPPAGELGSPGV